MGGMSLRIFGKSDDVLKMLLLELGVGGDEIKTIGKEVRCNDVWSKDSKVLVPYDREGNRIPEGSDRWMWLDLNDGAHIKLTKGHNVVGSGQPCFRGIVEETFINGVSRM